MSYPLIILGAGASFDFLRRDEFPAHSPELDQYIPPVSNRLFDGTKFDEIISKYTEMHRLVDYIRAKLRASIPKTFEQILSDLYYEKVKLDKELYTSFMSLLFYISDLFGTITNKYYRSNNNYGALLKMLNFYGNRAMFVNFNYDLLFEKTIGKADFDDVNELLNGNFPIIKIHGAFNWYWGRLVDLWGDENKNSYELSLTQAYHLFNPGEKIKEWQIFINKTTNPKTMKVSRTNNLRGFSFHPVLVLPTIGKNNYACPNNHIKVLQSSINQIDKIIIIGWKLGDPFLRNLIVNELNRRNVPIAYIGGNNTNNLIKTFDEIIKTNIKLVNGKGFSDFLSSEDGEKFLT